MIELLLLLLLLVAVLVVLVAAYEGRMSLRQAITSLKGGGVSTKPAKGGEAVSGMSYRCYEGDIAAVDTITNLVAFGGQAQTVQCPQGAAILNRVGIALSVDAGAAVISVRAHVQVRLIGQGIRASPQDFGGPAVSIQGVTNGNAMVEAHRDHNDLNIPVVGGGDIQVQAVLVGEDPGDVTVSVTLGYLLA